MILSPEQEHWAPSRPPTPHALTLSRKQLLLLEVSLPFPAPLSLLSASLVPGAVPTVQREEGSPLSPVTFPCQDSLSL